MFKFKKVVVEGVEIDGYLLVDPFDCEVELFDHGYLKDLFQHRPDVNIWYGDHFYPNHQDLNPCFDKTLFISSSYIRFPLIVRTNLKSRINELISVYDNDHDFIIRNLYSDGYLLEHCNLFRATHKKNKLTNASCHSLYTNSEAYKKLGVEIGLYESGRFGQLKSFEEYPLVSLIIPTCRKKANNGLTHIENFLTSLSITDWPKDKIQLIIGDDIEGSELYDKFNDLDINLFYTNQTDGFNYSKKINYLVGEATSEYLIILNDDIEIVSRDWIRGLLTFLFNSDVGGVGALLKYDDGTVQHAGIVGKEYGFLTHVSVRQRPESTYNQWAISQREFLMVTGAVFAIRKKLFTSMGGYDETFRLDYNDVDLCLKLRQLGYRIVYNGNVEFIHHESASRGANSTPICDTLRFIEKWGGFLKRDPHYNSALVKYAD